MFAAMSCIATMSLTSCATILSGSANKIYIDGDVDEPVTIVTEKQTYENVELPAMVKINRHGIDGQRVKIKSEHYCPRNSFNISKSNKLIVTHQN